MTDHQTCPRRILEFGPWDHDPEPLDEWQVREQFAGGIVARHCSHCGSLHPDDLMTGLRDGILHVGGSDKNYKWYIGRLRDPIEARERWLATDPTVKAIRVTSDNEADNDARIEKQWNLVKESYLVTSETKFYTPHLSRAQAREFLDMWEAKTLSHSMYVAPWFPSLNRDAPSWLSGEAQ